MSFFRRLFLKDRAGKFRGKILSGRKSGPGRKSGMSVSNKTFPLELYWACAKLFTSPAQWVKRAYWKKVFFKSVVLTFVIGEGRFPIMRINRFLWQLIGKETMRNQSWKFSLLAFLGKHISHSDILFIYFP